MDRGSHQSIYQQAVGNYVHNLHPIGIGHALNITFTQVVPHAVLYIEAKNSPNTLILWPLLVGMTR